MYWSVFLSWQLFFITTHLICYCKVFSFQRKDAKQKIGIRQDSMPASPSPSSLCADISVSRSASLAASPLCISSTVSRDKDHHSHPQNKEVLPECAIHLHASWISPAWCPSLPKYKPRHFISQARAFRKYRTKNWTLWVFQKICKI